MAAMLIIILLGVVVGGTTLAVYGWNPRELRVSPIWYFLLSLALLANTMDAPNTFVHIVHGNDVGVPLSYLLSKIALFVLACYLLLRTVAHVIAELAGRLRARSAAGVDTGVRQDEEQT